jgi:formylmethanofuran dehydrogenase subunit B
LCDDIVYGDTIYHACRKGFRILRGERNETAVNGKKTDIEIALNATRELVDRKLLIFGLDNTTCEAQKLALKLAKEFNAVIADHSLLSGGKLIEISDRMKEISLEKFRDEGYVSVFWGVNPHNSIPRLLSRFTYYPRCGKRQRGYEEDRFLAVVDVRKSETAKIAEKSKSGLFIRIERDDDLVNSFSKALDGKAGKHPEAARILKEAEKAEVNAVFGGSGLSSGLKDVDGFVDMMERTGFYFVPATSKTNMRGFVEMMLKEVGSCCYDFGNDKSLDVRGLIKAFMECETVLIFGADPLRTLPYELSSKLAGKRIIAVNSLKSLTNTLNPEVSIASELSSFSSGTMVRFDGVKVELKGIESSKPSDKEILKELLSI